MTDQTTPLRDRIAAALYDHSHPGWALSFPDLDQDQRDTYLARADAVLAVLPAPVDQAAPTAWVDGHPQLELIAAAVWEKCGRSDSGMCVEDDPRNIAVAALAAVLPATTNHDTDTGVESERREQYVAAMENARRDSSTGAVLAMARMVDAAMAVADAEINEHREHIAVYRKDSAAQYQIIAELQRENAELRRVADETAATETQAAALLRVVARWAASSEGRDVLVEELADAGYRLPHACGNCEGIDPDTCLKNPDRRKRPPMDPVHILGIEADDGPAAGVRQDETVAVPCVECDHPQTDHGEGEDPVTPGQCQACPDDDAWHDYQAATKQQDGAQPGDAE